ncbi:MAG: MBL fold metallo-hydrolase [Gammaproteobacteria bacterium]|nr:MBL fold metallo-hydrolase [Gammaproteobacteria bacterium]
MTAFASLGSGSRGNATCVRMGDALLLVDCGFSLRQAEIRLERLGVHAADIDAILVTHEHSDHASGVPALAARYGIEVHATHGTLRCFAPELLAGMPVGTTVRGGHPFTLKGVEVMPVTVPHDAREPVQFVFRYGGCRIGVISDLGCPTPHVLDHYRGCHGLFLESNHDREMLMRGSYPPRLKRRIAGDLGHLSNGQAGEFLGAVAIPEMDVVIGHVSERNNHPDLLEETFGGWRGRVRSLGYATQREGAPWTVVGTGAGEAGETGEARGSAMPALQLAARDGRPRQGAGGVPGQPVE